MYTCMGISTEMCILQFEIHVHVPLFKGKILTLNPNCLLLPYGHFVCKKVHF